MTTRELIAGVLAAIVLTIDVITDYRLRKKKINEITEHGAVKHDRGLLIRCIGLAPAMCLGWYRIDPLLAFAYWHLFDGTSNVSWKNNWFRIGTTSWIDRMQRKYPVITWAKYIGLVLSVLFYTGHIDRLIDWIKNLIIL